MKSIPESLKKTKYHGVRELAKAAEYALHSIGTSQEKKTVADIPNERTIRYYITEGLLDQAIEKQGVTSVFGYEHLLTLLVIKKLQSDGLPISVIKTLISDRSVEELEKLLGEEVHVFTNERELEEFRRSIGHTDDNEVRRIDGIQFSRPEVPPPHDKAEAKKYLESLLSRSTRAEDTERSDTVRSRASPDRQTGSTDWRRYEIVPGVELHIARSFRPPNQKGFRERLLVLIDGILRSRERSGK